MATEMIIVIVVVVIVFIIYGWKYIYKTKFKEEIQNLFSQITVVKKQMLSVKEKIGFKVK